MPSWSDDVVVTPPGVGGGGGHEMTSHLPPGLCSLWVPGVEGLVEQQGLQQPGTPPGSALGDSEAPPHQGDLGTLRHLVVVVGQLSADLPLDHTASTVLLLVATTQTQQGQQDQQEAS